MKIWKFSIGLKAAALMAALIMVASIGALAMAASTAPTNATGKNVQSPSYTGSIKIARNSNLSETQEAKALQKLAKITPGQAKSAALAKVNGTVIKVSLDNENGYLVYSVEVKATKGLMKDVKVDAGNGKVLHIDSNNKTKKETTGSDTTKESSKEMDERTFTDLHDV